MTRPTRRVFLAGSLGASVLAACTSPSGPSGGPSGRPSTRPSPKPPPDPDLPALRRSLGTERALAAAYVATYRRHPGRAKALAAYAARHQQHLATPVTPIPTPSGTPAPAPPTHQAALAALVTAERAAQVTHHAALQTVVAPGNALLLASFAACAAAHAAALGTLVEALDAD